ncbi:MAG: SLC45 family MFS transporter [Candidatus Marinimicrobia bacterium]|jgi:MFS family permease|nr:SLC45 family MFS transporter [Candidatus Neomarinimicrobiota bacterium]MBT3630773.1 SLC45 family MFS transporter [Candidatus Neomarinimicrobiota bacterium]MBT3825575.1 SLC45 family MFS transporter [Candidatus Neomarinimicrobiota bacterium]MBT4131205.1 SLC45 family MFS transporter [Candidatus Neomarinimicrobiota bacterium]MBT4296335.1 SLC45 family MFS transporter [Candidatus Neomarinimicrobiota bacterium]
MKFSYGRLLLLGFGFMGTTILWGIYNAYVPIFLQAGREGFATTSGVNGFGMSATATGFVMTLDNIAALFILPFIGAWSDRIRTKMGRRKPFIAMGAPLAFIGFIGIPMMLNVSLIPFMIAIFVTLFFMDVFRTPVISLMPDITPSPQRSQANGIINLMGGVGAVLAFVVGGILFKVSVGAPFYFGGIIMLIGAAVVLYFVKEPKVPEPKEEEPGLLDSFKTVLVDKDRSALFLLLAIFFWFLGYGALEVFFTSFAVNRFGVDSGVATGLLAFFSLPIVLFSPLSGYLGAKFGRKIIIMVGIAGFAFLLFWGFSIQSLSMIKIMLPLTGVTWSLILVNSLPMVVDMAPQDRLGTYTGLYYLSSQSSAIVGPIMAGKIIEIFNNNYGVGFIYGSITLLIALFFMLPVKRGEALPAE